MLLARELQPRRGVIVRLATLPEVGLRRSMGAAQRAAGAASGQGP